MPGYYTTRVIGKFYGATQVALYAIAFAILNYIRMFLGGLFAPFTSRFAHFRAIKDANGLKGFFQTVINITCPIVVCPLLALTLLDTNFVTAWSGPQYLDAVPLTTMFVLLNIFAFFSYPCGSIVTVFEKTKTIRLMALLMPTIYWLGIVLLPKSLSVLSFGIMKNCIFWLQILVYVVISMRILGIQWKSFFSKLIQYNLLPIVVVAVISLVAKLYISIDEKSMLNLLKICGVIMVVTLFGYGTAVLANPSVKEYVKGLYDRFFLKRK